MTMPCAIAGQWQEPSDLDLLHRLFGSPRRSSAGLRRGVANLCGELLELTLADSRLRELLPSGELHCRVSHRKVSLVRAANRRCRFPIVDGISEGGWLTSHARRSTT